MSVTISGIFNDPIQAADFQAQKPLPTPTTSQETVQLASTGQSAAEIAANLGLPVAEVTSTLGIGISTASKEAAAVLSTRLSITI